MNSEERKNRLFQQVSMDGGQLNENFESDSLNSEDKLKQLIERLELMIFKHEKMLNENHIIPKSSKEVYIVIGSNKFKGTLDLIK